MSPSDSFGPWLRGVLDPCLLALLADGEAYGYELAAQLDAQGLGRVPGGSLYPALLRMEGQGLLASEWRAGDGGPGRKYYRLTAEGRATLDADVRRWDAFASAVGGVLATARRCGPR